MKVLVIGELNVDIILDDFSDSPQIGREVLAEKMNITLGSSSAIFASNLSNLGNHVDFMGGIGNDYFAEVILKSFAKHKVQTQLLTRFPNHPTGATFVLNAGEDRANVTHLGAMTQYSIEQIDLNQLNQYQHLHISSYFFQPKLKKDISALFKLAKAQGLTTSFDMQWDPLEHWDIDLSKILPYVDIFFPNEAELINATHSQSLEEAINHLRHINYHICAVKQGNKGSTLLHNQSSNHHPGFLNTDVVDAIGAGDSFNAGFIHQYIRRQPLDKCQDYASLVAAISTTQIGGTRALEDRQYREEKAIAQFGKALS